MSPADTTHSAADRAPSWNLRTRSLACGRLPLVMGVLNVTPDSFSDGGCFLDPRAAVEHGLRLAEEGADVLDVGGQSTRPYASAVDEAEELRRLEPVLGRLCEQLPIPVSIDTTRAQVARHAVEVGAQIINDVSALTADQAMISLAAETGVAVCAMHMQGAPATMQQNPTYADVVEEVFDYLKGRRDALVAGGIPAERIALDPGIGFGKTTEHNLELLKNIGRFHALGCPLLVGHSRKAFLGKLLGDRDADRLPGTIAVALALARRGVQIVRVHDVAAVRQALTIFEASGGLAGIST